MRLWMWWLCFLPVVLSSKVCIVSEGLISLSLCTYIPLFPPLVAHRGWKLSNEVRSTLKGSSLPGLWIFVTPSLVYLSKPPRWNVDHSNPKLPLHLLPSSPSFICLHYFSCMWRKRSNLSDSRDPKDELKEGNGRLDKNTKGRLSSLPLLSSVSRHLKSHLGFISSGFYAWAAWWCANKERKGVREREWESKNVLIKGNSEGLYQIKLHNVVREDTAFDTEKMKLTCPQMAIHPHGMKWKCNQFTSATGIMMFLAWVLHVYLQWRVWSCAAHCGDGH